MVKRVVALLLLFFMAVQPALAADLDSSAGRIEGTLINKTAGTSNSVAGQTILLNVYKGNGLTETKTTSTDNQGKFSFDRLATDPAFVYEIESAYQEAEYFSGPLQFSSGETSKSIEVDVYDSGAAVDAISIGLSHVILSLENGSLAVKEYYLFVNNSDRAFIGQTSLDSGEKRETLKFSLPVGASNMQAGFGLAQSDISVRGNDFFDTSSVTPIGREISYSYQLPINSNRLTLSWKQNYAISRFDLLFQDDQIKVTSEKLTHEEPLNISGKNYSHFSSQNLVAGGLLTTQLSGLTGNGSSSSFRWAWLAAIPVLAIAAILIRRKRFKLQEVKIPSKTAKEKLLAEIVGLDLSYEDGQIGQAEYLRLRSEKKQRLKEEMQKLAEGTVNDR